jgi:hypothetical protein
MPRRRTTAGTLEGRDLIVSLTAKSGSVLLVEVLTVMVLFLPLVFPGLHPIRKRESASVPLCGTDVLDHSLCDKKNG